MSKLLQTQPGRSRKRPAKSFVVPALTVCLFVIASGSSGLSAEPRTVVPAAQVWLVDTRNAPGCGDLNAGLAQINYWRLDESGGAPGTPGRARWQAADAAAFQASADAAVPTTVLIHGYGTDDDWAVRHGNEVYGLMKQQAGGRAFRLVIWSWPSERTVRGIRPDVRLKVCRSDAEAYYLARLLAGMPRGEPLGLIGFSLGCRTVSGTLELLAGGSVAGNSLPPTTLDSWKNNGLRPIRVMMLGAAMDADWLEPCSPHGLAPLAVERILVTEDGRDRVLKWYSRLYGRGGPEALGYVGPAGPAEGKLEVVDLTCEVGRRHKFDLYEEASPVCQRLAWYTFLCEPPTVAENTAKNSDQAANNRPAR